MTEKSSPQPAPRHTPGPWCEGRFVATGLPIKLQMYGDTIWWPREQSDQEAQANLRLMDAAPDLLQALGHAKCVIEQDRQALADCHMDPLTNELDEDGAAGVAEYDAVLEQIDAAFTKATGGQA